MNTPQKRPKYIIHKKFRGPRIGAEKLRRAARVTERVRAAVRPISGNELARAKQIAESVLARTPLLGHLKEKPFFDSAHKALGAKPAGAASICIDRCNLAIGMLNASGIRSWLAREVELDIMSGKWKIHDYVEGAIGGKIHTIYFGSDPIEQRIYYGLEEGPVEKVLAHHKNSVFLRGADSLQIGGVKGISTLRRLRKRLESSPRFKLELEKNSRRIDLLVKEGIMPKEFAMELRKK